MARQKYSKRSVRKYARRKPPAWTPQSGYGPLTKSAIISATDDINARLKAVESNVRGQETKKHYYPQNETQLISTAGNLTLLNTINAIGQGINASQMDGVSYSLTGIGMKFLLHNNSATTGICRLAIIRLKSGQTMTVAGEELLLGNGGLGLDYNSATEYQRWYAPINRKKYDVVMERQILLGASNSSYTNNLVNNKVVKGYKRYSNRKEFLNASGDPNTNYVLVGWCVDSALDFTLMTVEVTGQTCVYYKDN